MALVVEFFTSISTYQDMVTINGKIQELDAALILDASYTMDGPLVLMIAKPDV